MTELNNLLVADLRRDEGQRLRPYRDTVGKLTIGVGRNLDDNGIRECESAFMLSNDIDDICQELDKALPWWRNLSLNRQRVLANMAFNMGVPTLLGFKNTLAFMKNGDYAKAASGMMNSRWATQVGERAQRLSDLMRKG